MEEADAFAAKAAESLGSAEDDFAKERHNSCARNSYYAAFQAAVAALLHEGIRPRGQWSHDFVRAEFSGRLVYRRKLYRGEFRSLLMEAGRRRIDADYTTRILRQRDVARVLAQVRELVTQVKEREHGRR